MDAKGSAIALSVGRIGIGVTLLAAPGLVARAWVGPDGDRVPPQVIARGQGARDVGLGIGLLMAMRDGSTRPWLIAGLLADGADLGAALAAGNRIPPLGRVGVAALAGGAVLTQLALLRELD